MKDFLKLSWAGIRLFLVWLWERTMRPKRRKLVINRTFWLSEQPHLLPKRYNRVTFAGTHNSYSNNSLNTAALIPYQAWVLNHTLSVTEQLDAGIRVIDIDIYPEGWFGISQNQQLVLAKEWGLTRVHLQNNRQSFSSFLDNRFEAINAEGQNSPMASEEAIAVYHGIPSFGRSSFTTLLTRIKGWVAQNPGEIVSINLTREKGMEDTGDEQQRALLNDKIKSFFIASGLAEFVFSYNIERQPDDPWPTLQEMIDQGKPVMVFGLLGAQQFNRYDNYYRPGGTGAPQPAWCAKSVDDLSPDRLTIVTKPGSGRLFLDNHFCSRRQLQDLPYLFAGYPRQAQQANRSETIDALAKACERELVDGQIVNWIWVDFFDPDDDGLLKAVYDLNMSRLV